jgi:hypothetical protein
MRVLKRLPFYFWSLLYFFGRSHLRDAAANNHATQMLVIIENTWS